MYMLKEKEKAILYENWIFMRPNFLFDTWSFTEVFYEDEDDHLYDEIKDVTKASRPGNK